MLPSSRIIREIVKRKSLAGNVNIKECSDNLQQQAVKKQNINTDFFAEKMKRKKVDDSFRQAPDTEIVDVTVLGDKWESKSEHKSEEKSEEKWWPQYD